MRPLLPPEILTLIDGRRWTELRDTLAGWSAPELADLLLHPGKEDRVFVFRALPRPLAVEVFSRLELEQQDQLLRDLSDEETQQLLADLPPDDRTNLLEELPGQAIQRLLNLLSPDDLREARWLLGYPEESVGRLMTPDYVAVHPEWQAGEALDHVRRYGIDSETINRVFVVDRVWKLLGDIELRRLILAPPETRLTEFAGLAPASVSAFADREEAVNVIRRYDQFVLPVVDSDGVLVGIVTADDLLDVQEEEATEDFHMIGSVGPFRTSLRDARISFLYRRRIGWLLVLVFVNIFSGAGIAAFQETIERSVALVFFLPLLIGSAGNAGSQSATMMIRALATGDVRLNDWARLLGKELGVALGLGLTMALGAAAVSYYRAP